MGLFDTEIDIRKAGELIEDAAKKKKDNLVSLMKKAGIKRMKIGPKEFEIELK